MIDFTDLPLDSGTLLCLSKLNIDYAFQPIFDLKNNTIVAYEALMRTEGKSPVGLIDEYEGTNKLHILEVATLFGATKTFLARGYQEQVCINSFSSEYMSSAEEKAYYEYFGKDIDKSLIIEIQDHESYSSIAWQLKKVQLEKHKVKIALDNVGMKGEEISAINVFEPNIVKLNRQVIKNIHTSKTRQQDMIKLVKSLHENHMQVLAVGVEKKEELDYIKSIDVDLAQGYYLGCPE